MSLMVLPKGRPSITHTLITPVGDRSRRRYTTGKGKWNDDRVAPPYVGSCLPRSFITFPSISDRREGMEGGGKEINRKFPSRSLSSLRVNLLSPPPPHLRFGGGEGPRSVTSILRPSLHSVRSFGCASSRSVRHSRGSFLTPRCASVVE